MNCRNQKVYVFASLEDLDNKNTNPKNPKTPEKWRHFEGPKHPCVSYRFFIHPSIGQGPTGDSWGKYSGVTRICLIDLKVRFLRGKGMATK